MTKEKIELTKEQQNAMASLGIAALNDMQCAAVAHCRLSNEMVLLAPTGTGKTLAYLLPLMEKTGGANGRGVRALVVLPSRELVQQVATVWRGMNNGISMLTLHGGRPVADEAVRLQNVNPTVVMGTPGRLIEHLSKGSLPVDECTTLVIDEFDKCLEMGFCDEMQRLVGLLPAVKARYLLSATDVAEIPVFVGADSAARLDFRSLDELPVGRTSFYKITTTPEARLQTLSELLCSFRSEPAIVFCNFRETVDEVGTFLAKQGLSVTIYHGALEQKSRELALFRFCSSCTNILVCTDLAARGLDIKDVKHIVHFQRPMTADVFTHRNGRTARWGAQGTVYMLSYHDHPLPHFVPREINEYGIPRNTRLPEPALWTTLYIGKGKRDKLSRGDIAGFLMKKGGLDQSKLGLIALYDRCAYVAVKRNVVRELLRTVANEKIKGMKTIIEVARV
ncbi:MAG: DEAD/DEAH box helicase [Bacteroidaceae bacterium]|nr:DEAD/DEAH box helicase [Bacteroidaceae bacterium]